MNVKQNNEIKNENRTRPTQGQAERHTQTQRSAAPIEIDNRGQRQRRTQYINSSKAEIERIKNENPDYVRHKSYSQPRVTAHSKRNAFVLVFVIFLCFSLSLLAVYGIANLLKEDTPVTETQGTDTNGSSTDTVSQTEQQTSDVSDTDEVIDSVYASVTPSTAELFGNVYSSNAILIDIKNNTILAQKSPDAKIYPASMTKIMTLLVAVENMSSLDQTATVTKQTTNYCYTEGASIAGFAANETVTVKDLLYGTILPSGADATMTLAECIAGSEAEFVKLMNKKAADLGLENTNFVNTSGLHHNDHYSTVHDISIILKTAIQNDICFKVLSASHYTTSSTEQHPNGIPLYSIVHSRTSSINLSDITIVGGKTGFTPEAGQCLATYAVTTDNKEYIFVSANGADKLQPVADAEYAYKTYALAKEESTNIAA